MTARRRTVLTIAAFALLGPAVGYLGFLSFIVVAVSIIERLELPGLEVTMTGFVLSYYLGLLPAVCCGWAWGAFADSLKGTGSLSALRASAFGALIGGVSAALWLFVLLGVGQTELFILAGAFAGAVLAPFFPRKGWREIF
jgi:hypothetical protein